MSSPLAMPRLLALGLLLPAPAAAQAEWARVPLFDARSGHAAAFDANGTMLVFGGTTGPDLLGDTWTWDGVQWQRLAGAVPTPRSEHAMVYDPVRAQFVLFGGRGANGDLSDTWVHVNGTWSRALPATSPSPRSGSAAAFHAVTSRMVVYGGRFNQQLRDDTWEWDGTTWTQPVLATRPPARSHAGLAQAVGSPVLTLFGGNGPNGALDDTWEWSGSGWSQRNTATVPPARTRAVLAAGPNTGTVVLTGGSGPAGALADAWRFDGSDWLATPAYDLPEPLQDAAAARNAAGVLHLVGGRGTSGPTSVLRGHAGAAWADLTPETAPPARLDAASGFDPVRGEWLVFGGEGLDGNLLQDLWRWDGTRWTRANVGTAPQARRGATLVHDPASGSVVLFGGFGLTALNSLPLALADTWRWDGTAWTQLTPTSSPPARGYAALCAMPGSQGAGLLLTGGTDTNLTPFGDAWHWNGTTWLALANPPFLARHGHAMALDTARNEVVLFGGRNNQTVASDTWTFDGTQWTQRATTGTIPAARQFHGFAHDPFRYRTLLHGGLDATFQPLADTWEWDGSIWRAAASLAVLPPRHSGAMGNDLVRRNSVWFGGTAGGLPRAETWTFASPNPPSVTAFGSGCQGSNGAPQAAPVATQLPWITGTLGVRLTNLPSAPGLFVFFFGSFRDTWMGNPLPLDLGGYGLPGCSALVRPQEFLFVGHAGGTHDWSTPVVSDPRLVGTNVFLQGLTLDAAAPNGLGATSNGLWAVLGRY